MDMAEISDDTVAKAADGDMAAFEAIYRAFSGFAYRVALRMVDDREDAEEIVQDVFLRVHGQLKNFRFEASIKTWIYRIAVNTTLNFRKKRNRTRARLTKYRDEMRYGQEEVKPAFAQSEDHENLVSRLLNALNPDQRACIVLRAIEGLSYEEIAETLAINLNTVRTRLKRAREKLLTIRSEVMNDEIH